MPPKVKGKNGKKAKRKAAKGQAAATGGGGAMRSSLRNSSGSSSSLRSSGSLRHSYAEPEPQPAPEAVPPKSVRLATNPRTVGRPGRASPGDDSVSSSGSEADEEPASLRDSMASASSKGEAELDDCKFIIATNPAMAALKLSSHPDKQSAEEAWAAISTGTGAVMYEVVPREGSTKLTTHTIRLRDATFNDLKQIKTYFLTDGGIATCLKAARDYLKWEEGVAQHLQRGGGWHRPGKKFNDGDRAVGRRVFVRGYGEGQVLKYTEALIGASSHEIQFDHAGRKTVTLLCVPAPAPAFPPLTRLPLDAGGRTTTRRRGWSNRSRSPSTASSMRPAPSTPPARPS